MAFGGFDQGHERLPASEINMVPLIDVMLVLLIVFMVTAPLLTHSINVDLPRATSTVSVEKPEAITLSLDADGSLFWNDAAVSKPDLNRLLLETAARTPQPELRLQADRNTRYQALAEMMSAAQAAGIEKMGFVTLPAE